MKTSYDCIPCLIKGTLRLFKMGIIHESKQEEILKNLLHDLSKSDLNDSPPKIATTIRRIVKKHSAIDDPYKEIKLKYNNICLNLYDNLKKEIKNSHNPLFKALKLALIGNIIDYAPNHSFNVDETIKKYDDKDLSINHSNSLFEEIKKSNTILYIGDNAGEIVFDKLFIELLGHKNIYFAVRGKPVLNDATKEDAYQIGLDKFVRIIDTGQDIPGVDLNNSSKEFLDIFNQADLIISKGQGNFESLNEINNKNIFFLLMAKCDLVAKELNVKTGDIVVKKHNFIKE